MEENVQKMEYKKINKDIGARDVSIILQGLLVGNIQMKLGKKLLDFEPVFTNVLTKYVSEK